MTKGFRSSWSPFVFPLVMAFAVAALCGLLYMREAGQIADSVRDRENVRLGLLTNLFERDITGVMFDLRVMEGGEGFQSFLADGHPNDLTLTIRRAALFSRARRDYDQIRYLDANGNEVFRVNSGGAVTPESQLQNKSNRSFFQEGMKLLGQCFISAFDLNFENGKIQQPIKPMIRVVTPVFDSAGKRRGIYIINYKGTPLLERLQRFVVRYQARLRVLNAQGYWLKAADPDMEWGFMFPERSGMTLAKTDPALWAAILKQNSGQMRYRGGLFSWRRIVPHQFDSEDSLNIVAQDRFLVIASEITAGAWNSYFADLRQTFLIVAGVLFCLAVISWWLTRERMKAGRALQESRAQMEAMLDNSPALTFIKDLEGRYQFVNRRFSEIMGLPREKILRGTVPRLFAKENRPPSFEEAKQGAFQSEETVHFSDGIRTYLVVKFPLRDAAWKVYGTAVIATDISERKRLEKERDQFFELSKDLLCILSHSGFFKRVNPAFEKTLGFSVEELMSRPQIEFVHPEDRQATQAFLQRILDHGAAVDFESRWRCRDGSYRWLSWSVASASEVERFFCVARDVTAQKEAEERLAKSNAELKQHATQLEAANTELESFSYSVSHDLRAPLRHIHGFVSLMLGQMDIVRSEKDLRYLRIIADAAKQMGLLIDDLLLFSRMSRAELRHSKVELAEMVAEVIQQMQPDLADRHIHWEVAPLPAVEADSAMLRQVWVNLLSNAVKYTKTRENTEISIGLLPETNGDTVIFVKDNGVGFDMKYAGKLFGVFQRLHQVDQFEGTGVGLANVRRIITRHGGKTWAEATVNSGATFFFSLPKVPGGSADQPHP